MTESNLAKHTSPASTAYGSQSRWAFPPLPRVLPMELSRAQVASEWPAFPEILDSVSKACEAVGRSGEMVAVIGGRAALAGAEQLDAYGSAVVIRLPDAFAPCLADLAVQAPSPENVESLDLMTSDSVYSWYAVLPDGRKFSLLMQNDAMMTLLDIWSGNRGRVPFVPVVFVAGDACVCGGFWFDADDEAEAQCVGLYGGPNHRPYRMYSDEELAMAAEVANQAGSPTPWKHGPWTNSDGITCIQLAVYQVTEPAPDGDYRNEDETLAY